ncbi:MAG: hypothetical protein HQ510_05880 [Candidatus Marinimicrobia bacterium]|nr:hypothetical protein [Candidatus Neomarinimicrobiota bacterium]
MISIIALTEDWLLSARLAKICSDFGCNLIMPGADQIHEVCQNNCSGIIIFDLTAQAEQFIEIGSSINKICPVMILGVTDNNIKTVRNQAIENGFQMVFTKRGFIRNLALIIKQRIQNEPGN